MKKHSVLLRLTSFWLALLVLTASVGLTVQQHTCRMSGRTQRAVVLQPHHGCTPQRAVAKAGCSLPQAAQALTADDKCCDFSAHHHKVDASAHDFHLIKTAVPAFVAVLPTSFSWPQETLPAFQMRAQEVLHAADASPPPRAGRALLTFVCTLVV